MPTLYFPNLDALRVALASRVVHPETGGGPARAAVDGHGHVWIEPANPLPKETVSALSRLGVQVIAGGGIATRPVSCWAELLPLRPASLLPASPVLFELPDSLLARFAGELRRLSPGPLAVRLLTDHNEGRAWLTCPLPPVSVLLGCDEPGSPVTPFVEQVPGVWVRRGWEHPLPDRLVFAPGRLLMLHPGRSPAWHDGPAPTLRHDDFALLRAGSACEPASGLVAVTLRLRLQRSGSPPPPESLWVFAGPSLARFREFCDTASEPLVRQFEAVTVGAGGETRVVVRPAAKRRVPPVLPVPADGYHAAPGVPGLFLPASRTLRPVVRPAALARLFGFSPTRLTWLEAGPGGEVVPHSVPVAAFRPLVERLDYTAPEPRQLAAAPPRGQAFAFARFATAALHEEYAAPVEADDLPAHGRHTRLEPLPPSSGERPGWLLRSLEAILRHLRRPDHPHASVAEEPPPIPEPQPPRKPARSPVPGRVEQTLSSADALLHGHARSARRHELEARLLDQFPRLAPERRAAGWADLAAVYGATANPNDAAVCWINAVWEADSPSTAWLEQWYHAEARAARYTAPFPGLDRWLGEPGRFGAGRVVAAYTAWAASQPHPPAELTTALPRVLAFLDQHFDTLPARAAWLARLAATRLCAGDALGLARWRDRVLARLRDKGPSLDLDEPSFLRFHGTASPDRFQTARDWLTRTRRPILEWVLKFGPSGRLQWAGIDAETDNTTAYAQLMLAWGLGCLGEGTRSRDWAARARKLLTRPAGPGVDPAVHALLADAFGERIRDVQEGRGTKPGLPPDLLARLEQLPNFSRYSVNRLRDHCRILEPAGSTLAFGGLDLRHVRGTDLLGERLQLLADHTDPAHLADEARQLLDLCEAQPSSTTVPRVALTLLDLAPHLDGPLVGSLLAQVVPAVSWLEAWLQAGRWTDAERADRLPRYLARLLGGAFSAAAQFNQWPALRPVVDHLLRRAGTDAPLRAAVGRAAGSLFRSFRKLGYRTEAESLLQVLDPGRGEWPADSPLPPSRLGLAVGWFAAGDEDAGNRILDEARRRLFVTRIADDRDRTELAIAYAEALGFAPPRIALGRLEEIFQGLDRVTVTGSTNRYYTLKPLQLIDAVVRSVVTEDFALGPAVRGWLDDDEFLIRRRIHRDMAAVLRDEGIS